MFSISNATGTMSTTYSVDISAGDTYTHRATAFHKDGLHYGRIRTVDGETIAETVAGKGITMNTDDFHAWVFNTLRSN